MVRRINQIVDNGTCGCKQKVFISKKKGQKMKLWNDLANELTKKSSIDVTAIECDNKWRGLLNQYRKVYDASKVSGNYAIKWKYYNILKEALEPIGKIQSMSPPKGNFFILFNKYNIDFYNIEVKEQSLWSVFYMTQNIKM